MWKWAQMELHPVYSSQASGPTPLPEVGKSLGVLAPWSDPYTMLYPGAQVPGQAGYGLLLQGKELLSSMNVLKGGVNFYCIFSAIKMFLSLIPVPCY